ncbi:MAG: hypothetical protein MJZ19_07360 [Paludibacteraceae bacterium]|nr:hypothetical protein [Paludibacteraceae bacterium]
MRTLFANIFLFLALVSIDCRAEQSASDTILPQDSTVKTSTLHGCSVLIWEYPSYKLFSKSLLKSDYFCDWLHGLYVQNFGGLGGLKTINIASLGSRPMDIGVDGFPVSNLHGPMTDIDMLSFKRFGSASVYYSLSTPAYIDKVTDSRPKETAVDVGIGVGSFGTFRAEASADFKDHGFIDASFLRTKGDYPFECHTQHGDTSGVRRNSDVTSFRLYGGAAYKDFELLAFFKDSESGLPGSVSGDFPHAYSDSLGEKERNFFTTLKYSHKFLLDSVPSMRMRTRRLEAAGSVNYTNDRLDYSGNNDAIVPSYMNIGSLQQGVHGAVACRYLYVRHRLNLTPSIESEIGWNDLNAEPRDISYMSRLQSKTSLNLNFHNEWSAYGDVLSSHKLFAYAQASYSHIEDNVRLMSLPLDKMTYHVKGLYCLYGTKSNSIRIRPDYSIDFHTPSLNDICYAAAEGYSLQTSYFKKFNLSLEYDFFHSTHSHENGQCVLQHNTDLSFKVKGHIEDVENRLLYIPSYFTGRWFPVNYGNTRCKGLDFCADLQFDNHQLKLEMLLSDDRNVTDPSNSSYNEPVPYSANVSAKAKYVFSFETPSFKSGDKLEWMISPNHLFVGKHNGLTEDGRTEALPSYNSTNLKIVCQIKRVTVDAECRNIFNNKFQVAEGWPMPGRQFYVALRYLIWKKAKNITSK